MAYSLTKDFVILFEGPADQVFLAKLLSQRGLQEFDLPPHEDYGKHFGSPGFGKTLTSISGDPSGYKRLKGILIITDSMDDVSSSFATVCEILKDHGPLQRTTPLSARLLRTVQLNNPRDTL